MPDQSPPLTRERFESEFRVALSERSASISHPEERENTRSASWRLFKAASEACYGTRSRISPLTPSDVVKVKAYLNGPEMAVARSKLPGVFTLLNETFTHGEQALGWLVRRPAPSAAAPASQAQDDFNPSTASLSALLDPRLRTLKKPSEAGIQTSPRIKGEVITRPLSAADAEYASWLQVLQAQQKAEKQRQRAGEKEYASWFQPVTAPSQTPQGPHIISSQNASPQRIRKSPLQHAKEAYVDAWTKIHTYGVRHEISDAPRVLTGSYSSCPWLHLSKENFEDRLKRALQTSSDLHILSKELKAAFDEVRRTFYAYHDVQNNLKDAAKAAEGSALS